MPLRLGPRLRSRQGMPSAFGEHINITALSEHERRVNHAHVIHFYAALFMEFLEPFWQDIVLDPHAINFVVVFLNRIADLVSEESYSASALEAERAIGVEVRVRVSDHLQ